MFEGAFRTGLTAAQASELAYVVVHCLGRNASECSTFHNLATGLDLAGTHKDRLWRAVQRAGLTSYTAASDRVPTLSTCMGDPSQVVYVVLRVLVRLADTWSRSDFTRFADFQQSSAASLQSIEVLARSLLLPSTADFATDNPFLENGGRSVNGGVNGCDGKRKALLARLRGLVRRLDEPEEQYFDESERSDGLEDLEAQVATVVTYAKQRGLGLPDLPAQLMLCMLTSLHDDLSESGYVDGAEELQRALEGPVGNSLGVDRSLYSVLDAWFHLHHFLEHREPRALQHTAAALRNHAPSVASAPDSPAAVALAAMLQALHDSTSAAFTHYTPDQLPQVLDVVRTASRITLPSSRGARSSTGGGGSSGGGRSSDPVILLLRSSVDAEVDALWEEARESVEAQNRDGHASAQLSHMRPETALNDEGQCVLEFLRRSEGLLDKLLEYTACLQEAPDAHGDGQGVCDGHACAQEILIQLHTALADRYKHWLAAETAPLNNSARVVRSMASLELRIKVALGAHAHRIPRYCADAPALRPLLYDWVCEQAATLAAIVRRICSSEEWPDAGRESRGGSPQADSAVEICRLFSEALRGLFDLDVPTSGAVVRTLLEKLQELAMEYAGATRRGCEEWAALVRPPPPLTRYKQKLAHKAASGLGDKTNMEKLLTPADRAALSKHERALHDSRQHSLGSLLARVNSARHVGDHLRQLSSQAVQGCRDNGEVYGLHGETQEAALEGCFADGIKALDAAQHTVCQYIAHTAVFVSLSDVWTDKLYMHRVNDTTCAMGVKLLSRLDAILGDVMALAVGDLQTPIAAALARATFKAFEEVLLHGGQHRHFISDDADTIHRDVMSLKTLLHADGDGVSQEQLQKLMGRLLEIIEAMSLQTGLLCDNMDALQGHTSSRRINMFDYDTLLCVLSHRADRIASKYLKEKVKMRKLDGKRGGFFS